MREARDIVLCVCGANTLRKGFDEQVDVEFAPGIFHLMWVFSRGEDPLSKGLHFGSPLCLIVLLLSEPVFFIVFRRTLLALFLLFPHHRIELGFHSHIFVIQVINRQPKLDPFVFGEETSGFALFTE